MPELNETYKRIRDGESMRLEDWTNLRDAESCIRALLIVAETHEIAAGGQGSKMPEIAMARRLLGR